MICARTWSIEFQSLFETAFYPRVNTQSQYSSAFAASGGLHSAAASNALVGTVIA